MRTMHGRCIFRARQTEITTGPFDNGVIISGGGRRAEEKGLYLARSEEVARHCVLG